MSNNDATTGFDAPSLRALPNHIDHVSARWTNVTPRRALSISCDGSVTARLVIAIVVTTAATITMVTITMVTIAAMIAMERLAAVEPLVAEVAVVVAMITVIAVPIVEVAVVRPVTADERPIVIVVIAVAGVVVIAVVISAFALIGATAKRKKEGRTGREKQGFVADGCAHGSFVSHFNR